MFVKVIFNGKVIEVMISDKGTSGEAIKAAGVPDGWHHLWVTGVSVCTGTRLRSGDVIVVE